MLDINETIHPHDPDAYEVTWNHDGHNHFLVVPRELIADGKTWIQRHATRVNDACGTMFKQASV